MDPLNHKVEHKGLTLEEVEQSRLKYGLNLLTPPKRASLLKLYLEKFKDPVIRILLLAAVLSLGIAFIEGDYIETIGIFFAIFLATGIGFYFEYDAARRFEALNAMGQENKITVRRGGHITQVLRSEIVVGDIVLLEQGVEVPADGVLFKAVNLQLNESSLTGEAVVHKTCNEALFDAEATYPSNEALRSTMVVDGHGAMEVTAVGDATEIGKVAKKATELTGQTTPLNEQLARLAKFINRVAFTIAVLAFLICTTHELVHQELLINFQANWLKIIEVTLKNFMMAVSLIVMAVPEGLPMAVTLSLALNMRRMLKTNNLVRKMHACETMGAITVICTDKTGTLTQNRMQVSEFVMSADSKIELIAEGIATNSTAHIEGETGEGVGNPTECALLLWLKSKGHDYNSIRTNAAIVNQLTFSTERKYMATIVTSTVTGKRLLYVKGAPEIVVNHCTLPSADHEALKSRLLGYQKQAMRTLAFAMMELTEKEGTDCKALVEQNKLTYLGVVAINDPVRAEVPAAVEQCTDAGIGIKIVTGDTSGTAIEIARRIGLWKEEDTAKNCITGPEWAALSDEAAFNCVMALKVMSRARPMDKQRLVEMLQKHDMVVAVTGDGTNDAPALNHAQVGLSMGSGTSVAKEASDITLLDDSFRSIATAVMWGRSLYKNIQRFILFQLTINFVALCVVLIGSFIGTDLPLTVTQILWINIIMDTFAAMALASVPPSQKVMEEKPRKAEAFIITKAMKSNILITGLFFIVTLLGMLLWQQDGRGGTPEALTEFFTFFVLLQFWNLFNAKAFGSNQSTFRNLRESRGMLLVLLLILVGQWLIVEFGGKVFRTVPLSLNTWLILLAASSLTLWIGEGVRAVKRLLNPADSVPEASFTEKEN
ncbi:MAG: calcium-translocating P-type ATPase, PMCA-type [Bacteroidaceae bacterium]